MRRLARSEPALGSEKPWHQTCSPLRIAREVERLLLVRALGDERRAGVQQADEVHAHVGRAGALGLLDEDEVLGGCRAAAAVLLGPVDPRVPRVEQHPLPAGVPHAARGPVIGRRFRRVGGDGVLEPLAQLVAEVLLRRRCSAGPCAGEATRHARFGVPGARSTCTGDARTIVGQELVGSQPNGMLMAFGSRYASRPSGPSSRPTPDCLYPPKGAAKFIDEPLTP